MKNCQYCQSELVTFEGEVQPVILDKIHGFVHEFEETILSLELEKHQKNMLIDLVERMRSEFPHNGEPLPDTENDLKSIQYD